MFTKQNYIKAQELEAAARSAAASNSWATAIEEKLSTFAIFEYKKPAGGILAGEIM